MRRAQQRAEIKMERTEREREIAEAQIHAKEEVEKTRLNQERVINAERIQRDQELERLEILRHKARALEEQERIIAIAHKSREQSEAETAAEAARALVVEAAEKVETIREREVAERRKVVELLEASQNAERETIRITALANADLTAAADRAKAEMTAAEAARFRYDVDAEGRRKLNEAENMRSAESRKSTLHEELVRSLPAIIRESVKPMESIESIKILQVDGLPGLSAAPIGGGDGAGAGEGGGPRAGSMSDSVVNSALRYRTQISFVDGLLREIGLPTEIAGGTSGLTIFPVGEAGEERPKPPRKKP
jgi:uncharacterized membrane protein YqiK